MKKIRIGNDIRLAVNLKQYIGNGWKEREVYNPAQPDFYEKDRNLVVNKGPIDEMYYPSQYTQEDAVENISTDIGSSIAIKYARAFLINRTKREELQKKLKNEYKFISRFPLEPYCNAFDSTAYNINGCGMPHWHTYPFVHRIVPYGGFGVNPDWERIYNKVPTKDLTKYCARVFPTMSLDTVEIDFPARDLKLTGVYDIVVIVKVYAPGYSVDATKTITVDFPKAFELVSTTAEAEDSDIISTANLIIDILPADPAEFLGDRYISDATLDELGNDLVLQRSDGHMFNIDLDDGNSWWYDEE